MWIRFTLFRDRSDKEEEKGPQRVKFAYMDSA